MKSSTPASQRDLYRDDDDKGVSFLDLLIYIGLNRTLLLAVTVVGTFVGVALALWLPRYYVARAVVLPPQQQQSAASGALAQLGALAGVASAATSIKSPEEMYVAFMRTRRLQDALIQKLDLQRRYESPTREAARAELSGRVMVQADKKTGLITIEATDGDAAFAARLANEHVDELRKLLATVAVTDAQQRRAFFEQQVTKTQRALVAAEQAFRVAQAQGGLVVSQALAEGGIKESALVRGQIAAREVQLSALSRFATQENPDVMRLTAELAALRRQLAGLEAGRPGVTPTAGGQAAVQAYRDMKVQEAMLEVLIRQYEMAKVDESREGPLLQAIDPATPPERPTKPKRATLLLSAALLSLFAGTLIALFRGATTQANRHGSVAWQRLKAAWR